MNTTEITATLENGRIVVRENGEYRYSVPANDESRNQYGQDAGMSWGEAFDAGIVSPVNEPGTYMHGSLLAWQ